MLMELRDSFREALVILQLLISADWSSNPVLCRNAAVPNKLNIILNTTLPLLKQAEKRKMLFRLPKLPLMAD